MELSEAIIKALGTDYKEELTAEEVISMLNSKKIADLSKGEYVSTEKYNSAVSGKKKVEDELNTLKTAQMSDDEKKEAELKAKDSKIAEVESALRKAQAEKVFATSGIAEEDYADIVDFVTPEQATKFVEIINKTKETAKQEAEEKALHDFKSPTGGKTPPEKKWSEMSLDERAKLYETDPATYKKLKEQHT